MVRLAGCEGPSRACASARRIQRAKGSGLARRRLDHPPRRMTRMLDRVIAALQQRLQRETGPALHLGMHYPTSWDPFLADYMGGAPDLPDCGSL